MMILKHKKRMAWVSMPFVCLVVMIMILSPTVSFSQNSQSAIVEEQDGFRWIPWLSAGDQIWRATLRIEPALKDIIGKGQEIYVAITDLDYSGQNEIIIRFIGADDCGTDGCLYLILGNNGNYKRAFIAHHFKRSGQGVNVDGRYYKL
jgi:hypothetical protein